MKKQIESVVINFDEEVDFEQIFLELRQQAEESKKLDSSIKAGIEKLTQLNNEKIKDNECIENLVFYANEENLKFLKLPAMALLLKHLKDHGINTDNCVIAHDPEYEDSSQYNLPNLHKVIKYAIKNNKDLNIIYKSYKGHDNLIIYRPEEDKKLFHIFDSTGDNGSSFVPFKHNLINTIKECKAENNTYVVLGSKVRQHENSNCSIFVYKDLKEILQNPELLISQNLLPVAKQEMNSYVFPSCMMKLTQSMTQIKLRKTDHTLLNYVEKGKNGYGVESPVFEINSKSELVKRNKISDYFKQKYIQKTLPEIIQNLCPEEMIDLLNKYDFNHIEPLGNEGVSNEHN
jgi:hypothetical protein